MNALIVYAHPEPRLSSNAAMRDAARAELESLGHRVAIDDLYGCPQDCCSAAQPLENQQALERLREVRFLNESSTEGGKAVCAVPRHALDPLSSWVVQIAVSECFNDVGKANPTINACEVMANALGLTVFDLFEKVTPAPQLQWSDPWGHFFFP